MKSFEGCDVVVTEKLDGENTTIYPDGFVHARSLAGAPHESQTRVRALASEIGYQIPENWRICGENVFAKHSISYKNLSSFFYVFSIWEGGFSLPWSEVEDFCEILGLHTVPILYQGPWSEKIIRNIWSGKSAFGDEGEGYVIRVSNSFHESCFDHCVAKYVRANHVTSDSHWKYSQIIPNSIGNPTNNPKF